MDSDDWLKAQPKNVQTMVEVLIEEAEQRGADKERKAILRYLQETDNPYFFSWLKKRCERRVD